MPSKCPKVSGMRTSSACSSGDSGNWPAVEYSFSLAPLGSCTLALVSGPFKLPGLCLAMSLNHPCSVPPCAEPVCAEACTSGVVSMPITGGPGD